jgi:ubiquinone/menaquinone biosynthesis C-methylase UbiE
MTSIFDPIADAYDSWYDSPEGYVIFNEELLCLKQLGCDSTKYWLEVGVGTGRFAKALGIPCGIDLSPEMAVIARRQGIAVQVGSAEQLPFKASSFDGILMNLTLCFIARPELALSECVRVIRDKGHLIVGTIPADSSWGKLYIKEKSEGHPIYSHAHFRTLLETIDLVEKAGFRFQKSQSALLWGPDSKPPGYPKTVPGAVSNAGFVGLLFAVN